jgi:hypothetical protein
MPRTDHSDAQHISGFETTLDEQHGRRIVDLAQQPRIGIICLGDDIDLVLAT